MEFVIGALVMLFGVLIGAALITTAMGKKAPTQKDVDKVLQDLDARKGLELMVTPEKKDN